MKHLRSSQAFTLIELSIVLVIISLIVGGIIGGKSLIHSAGIQSITHDINKYRTAINNFNLQYDALPGDFNEATSYWPSASTANGNNDGIIANSGEYLRAWQHLSLAQVIEGSYTGALSGGAAVIGVNMPKAHFDRSGWQFESYNIYQQGAQNYLFLGRQLNAFLDTGVLAAKDAFNIDKKLDDGNPAAGSIVHTRGLGANDGQCVDKVHTAAPPVAYNKSNNDARCLLLFYFQR